MNEYRDPEPARRPPPDYDVPTARVARQPGGLGGRLLRLFVVAAVAAATSAVVTLALNFVLVPAGVGWKHLEYEGTVTVPGGAPFRVDYPGRFAGKPSLHLEAVGNDSWFYEINEQDRDHFTVTNTTVNRQTGTPVFLTLRWKATGSRW